MEFRLESDSRDWFSLIILQLMSRSAGYKKAGQITLTPL